ncbi:MAG TPA: glycosyltransferase [Dermatophilaceae bacterium]|nr:glycosyltransferase [Dermatophilaceae bacterium]
MPFSIALVLGLEAAAVAAVAATTVRLPVTSDVGLVAALPVAYWLGVLGLNVAFLMVLRSGLHHRSRSFELAVLLSALVFVLNGAGALASGSARGEAAFRHAGITDALISTGQINPEVDAYFSWPGFFAFLATLSKATGIDALALTAWAPVVNALLWLPALALVARALTPTSRARWLALWLFCLGNWIDQDYLSPQAFGFLLYLAVIGLLLGQLSSSAGRPAGWRWRRLQAWWQQRRPEGPGSPAQRRAVLLLCVLLAGAIIASHQLTPFMLIVSVAALVVIGRCWATGLPAAMALMLVIWLVFPASSYLVGHPPLADSGIGLAASTSLTGRVVGTPGHVVVVFVRIAVMAAIWLLAGAGAWLLHRRGRLDGRLVALAVAPFLVFPAQSYGGEILLRVALFSLPFTSVLAAEALLAPSPRMSRRRTVGVGLACFLLALGTVTSRYGNARFDMFTAAETQAAQRLYQLAPPGGTLIAWAHPALWQFRDYLDVKTVTVAKACGPAFQAAPCVAAVLAAGRHNPKGALVILTRSGESSLTTQGLAAPDQVRKLKVLLAAERGVQLAYTNADARIYRIGEARG